jgi:hypothetical protein
MADNDRLRLIFHDVMATALTLMGARAALGGGVAVPPN